jgi:hypothetical protein
MGDQRMAIRLTEEKWANVMHGSEVPVRVSDPAESATFVLVRADAYERFKALFEEDPVTEQERLFQFEQFGRRAGWDDLEMDLYDDLDPRRKS